MSSPIIDSFPRNANSAGAPLPIIPRRTPSSSSSIRLALPITPTIPGSPSIILQKATPPDVGRMSTATSGSSTSSTSSSESDGRTSPKRNRDRGLVGAQSNLTSPSPAPRQGTSSLDGGVMPQKISSSSSLGGNTASSTMASLMTAKPLVYTPGMMSNRPTLAASSSGDSMRSSPPDAPPPVARKKSGEVVRSSLKGSKPKLRGNLSVITGFSSSKSEPNTPSLKSVHFDTKEHVKLFLAEQKPLAVSRDGSPTDDTSGTESDFPPFIYGDRADKSNAQLVMRVANMPPLVNKTAEIALEEVKLSSESNNIVGRIRVRNLAFHKSVAVRFTFDAWQTTSEVTGRYVQSLSKDFDVFAFTIKLSDMLSRIEGKTLIMALRYAVDGKEYWDNNRGHNYLATFASAPVRKSKSGRQSSSGEETPSSRPNLDDLSSRLEKVAQRSESPPQEKPSRPPPLTGSISFNTRYDFESSFKAALSDTPLGRHIRTNSVPSPGAIPWPSKYTPSPSSRSAFTPVKVNARPTLGSPRDLDSDTFRPAPYVASEMEDSPFTSPTRVSRYHHRGYFDINILSGPSLRRTPPGTPTGGMDDVTPAMPARCHSFPPVDGLTPLFSPVAVPVGLTPPGGDTSSTESSSELSTPSFSSPVSTACSSPSPVEGFVPSSLLLGFPELPKEPSPSYSQFLDRFCFYTGPNSAAAGNAFPGSLGHSPPTFDDLETPSPLGLPFLIGSPKETRDDMAIRSGSSTPTSTIFINIPDIAPPTTTNSP